MLKSHKTNLRETFSFLSEFCLDREKIEEMKTNKKEKTREAGFGKSFPDFGLIYPNELAMRDWLGR